MDITPELIAEIDFPDALKGFDKDSVDDFLGQVGTELGRVHYELRKAERRIAELEDDASQASAQPSLEAAESDAVKATRTIMAAQETADRIESDATTEAEKTLSDAKAEGDASLDMAKSESKRLLAEAHAKADRLESDTRRETDEMLVAGKRRAEDEYDARVADYERLLGEQEQRSDALAHDIDSLEARVGEYRSVLERLVEEVRRVLDDPDELRFRPTLELSAPAAPVGAPAPVPGSVVPEEQVSGDASTDSGAGAGWKPGSWSSDLEANETTDVAASGDLVDEPEGLKDDASEPVGAADAGDVGADVDRVEVVTDDADDDHPATSEMALPSSEAEGATADEAGSGDAHQDLDGAVDHATAADSGFDPSSGAGGFDPDAPFDADEPFEATTTFDASTAFDGPEGHDAATRDDLTFSGLAAGVEPTTAFEVPGVADVEPDSGNLTGEYQEFEPSDGPAPQAGEGSVPSQLQAFAGDVDSMAGQPYVPKKFQDTPGSVPSATSGHHLDVADDAFTESGSPRTPEPTEMPAGVEFVDLGDDQPGTAAFSAEPGAFAPNDPYLSDLHDAVNNPDDSQAFTEFGSPDDDDDEDQKGLKRFFGR